MIGEEVGKLTGSELKLKLLVEEEGAPFDEFIFVAQYL
jgi:hypothetical protein